MVPVRRLHDFARLTAELAGDTPVAYWDVGEVLFQDSLKPLWNLVAANPGKLLAVAEPRGTKAIRVGDRLKHDEI